MKSDSLTASHTYHRVHNVCEQVTDIVLYTMFIFGIRIFKKNANHGVYKRNVKILKIEASKKAGFFFNSS